MTTSTTKVANGKHEGAPSAKHNRSEARLGAPTSSPKARDIEAIALSNLHGDPMMQYALSSVRNACNGIVERWGAIVRRLTDFRC
jgi:hypothetical protein